MRHCERGEAILVKNFQLHSIEAVFFCHSASVLKNGTVFFATAAFCEK